MKTRTPEQSPRTVRHSPVFQTFEGFRISLLLVLLSVTIQLGFSQKKGVGLWEHQSFNLEKAVNDLKPDWYYNWLTSKPINNTSAQFVPMIWGWQFVTDADLDRAKTHGNELLGFNEPDGPNETHQANMTVEHALDLWPRLMETGMRLGSPGTANPPDRAGSWLEKFMQGVEERDLRVDFICLHWYGYDFTTEIAVKQLRDFLISVHEKFKRPIWLTEYSLIAWGYTPMFPSLEIQAAFASESARMLDSLPFVERYAWFSLHRYGEVGAGATENSFLHDGDSLTAVGKAYGKPSGVVSLSATAAKGRAPIPTQGKMSIRYPLIDIMGFDISGRRINRLLPLTSPTPARP